MMEFLYLEQVLESNNDKIAVIHNENVISYKELYHLSGNLSRTISTKYTLKSGDNIIIAIDKSIEAILAIFGVLFSGVTYIPLNISLPKEKIHYIINQCNPRLIICKKNDIPQFIEDYPSIPVIEVSYDNGIFSNSDDDFGNVAASQKIQTIKRSPADIAYVIFTSGTNGIPKGVMIKHESVTAFIKEVDSLQLYDNNTIYLNISPFYFDASITDIFSTFYAKGTLVILDRFTMPHDLVVAINKYQITDTLMVSSVLRLFASKYSLLNSENCSSLKTIWYGGEACPVNCLREVKAKLPNVTFIHGYGPTETTHTATLKIFKEIDSIYSDYMPIGKPLNTVIAYILDENGDLITTPNVIGELYLGGIQLMHGYMNDKTRTLENVICDITIKEYLFYKTGDFVKYDNNDDFIFCGRNDDLVKVGGHLVSLIEIENIFLKADNIKDAIVVTQQDDMFNNHLNAFVVAYKKTTEKEIFDIVKTKLATFMMPQRIVILETQDIPRTSNGKVDKRKLLELIQ